MKTFHDWINADPIRAMWHRCDTAALHNPGHPHHAGAAKSRAARLKQWRQEQKKAQK